MASRAEYRLVLKQGDVHVLAWQMTITPQQIVAGGHGEQLRFSYHPNGWQNLYGGPRRLGPETPLKPIGDLRAPELLAGFSIGPFDRPYTPKRDTPYRRTLIVDPAEIPIPVSSWTVSLVAIPGTGEELVESLLQEYERQWLVIGALWAIADPLIFAGVVSTFTVESWNAIHEQIAARPAPGPLRSALLREREAFVAQHRYCGGFESGFANGLTWMACKTCGVRVERAPVPDGA